MDWVDLLRSVGLFAGLDRGQVGRVVAISTPVEFKDGNVIISQGEKGDRLYVIGEGQVEVIVGEDPATARTALYLGQGQIFGEMALIDYGERSATIRCASDRAVIAVIKREDFEQLCQSDTGIGYVVMRNLASDLSFKLRLRNLDPKAS
ncbi:MAG: cyclic nucleotide-binding domain-containing protein [Anaerolineae bacterium]|nr:cyclic nucleotide-binding domain-containing protein [Anaerolineae bacterium]